MAASVPMLSGNPNGGSMKTVFGFDTDALPVPLEDLPAKDRKSPPVVFFIPYRFESGCLAVLWPDGSPWMVTHQVNNQDQDIHNFVLRAFWSLPTHAKSFSLGMWQSTGEVNIPGACMLMVTDEELMPLCFLEYSESEARMSNRTRIILAPGKCPEFKSYFPVAN